MKIDSKYDNQDLKSGAKLKNLKQVIIKNVRFVSWDEEVTIFPPAIFKSSTDLNFFCVYGKWRLCQRNKKVNNRDAYKYGHFHFFCQRI